MFIYTTTFPTFRLSCAYLVSIDMADVYLYIYDLSMGMSKLLSEALLGRRFDGIWHTGVVVYNVEYYFGQEGISSCSPGSFVNGQLIERKHMGHTRYTYEEVTDYINALSRSQFKPGSYELLRHNCNSFSAKFVKYLTDKEIPSYITNLPSDFLSTPLGMTFRGVLDGAAMITDPSSSGFTSSCRRILSPIVRPVLFDEPLSNEFSSNALSMLFSGNSGIALQWANSALTNLMKLSSPSLDSTDIPLEALGLLKFNRWATFKQCEAVCEVFRLAVWRCPELILSLLTDPNESLHQLANTYPALSGQISPSSYFDLDAAKCHLLCNILALSYDWDMAHLPFIPLEPVAALCVRLISCEVQEVEVQPVVKPSAKSPEHEMAGLALTVNFAMCPMVSEQAAMEVAASLFHLLSVKTSFKHPNEAFYILKAVYALVQTFSSLADLAKMLEINKYIPELESQAEYVEGDSDADLSHVNAVKSIAKEIISKISK